MTNELHPYQDRKKLKWNGFYLSEHTSQLAAEKKERRYTWPAKPAMTTEEIGQLLTEARIKDQSVALQKEEMDVEGHYPPDVVGKIQGYDELGIYIAGEKIHYDEIRSVALHKTKKWSALD